MPRLASNSLLNSLKGKIWLATSALAFFICAFGLLSYIIVSLLTDDPFYAVFIPFLFLAFAVMVFGWWLSNEVVSPIEKVTLLAKSLERGLSTSLPKTSGSTETDELLYTLHRNNRQIHDVINLMEQVAGGNFSVALTPLQNSDRLTASFQQLLGKVSGSIHAQQNLEKLQSAVDAINRQIGGVRKGNLNVEVESDSAATREIAETLNYLLQNLNEIIAQVKTDAKESQTTAAEMQKTIGAVVARDETRAQEMNQAAVTLKQVPTEVYKIAEDLSGSALSANQTIEKARAGSRAAQANLSAVSQLRAQIQEAIKQIQKLNERAQEIGKIAQTVGDLAQRTNLIALNASIHAEGAEAGKSGMAVVVEEIQRLATRAENTNRQISDFNKSVTVEINQAERLLQTTVGEAANLSKFAIETSNSLSEMEKYIGQFLNLQNKLVAYSQERASETDKAFQVFVDSIADSEKTIVSLHEFNSNMRRIAKMMENLNASVIDFKLAETAKDFGSYPPAFQENYAIEENV